MSGADWAILGLIVLSVVLAASQGFLFEVFSLAGVVVGYLLAAWQYHRLAASFAPYVKSEWVGEIAAFLVLFLATVIAAGIIGRIARWLLKEAGLSWFDRVLGGAFGVLRGCLLVAVVLVAQASFGPGAGWLARSQLAPYFLVVGRAAIWLAPSELRARFHQGLAALHHAGAQTESGAPPQSKPPVH